MAKKIILTFALFFGLSIEGIVCNWSWSFRNDNGPKYWNKIKDDCSKDKLLQSPIDIPKPPARKYDKSMQELEFINYDTDIKGEVKNLGYAVVFNTTHENNKKMYIQKGRLEIGAKYVPAEFHFHFGTKDDSESGHKLEGKKFPMEWDQWYQSAGLFSFQCRKEYSAIGNAKIDSLRCRKILDRPKGMELGWGKIFPVNRELIYYHYGTQLHMVHYKDEYDSLEKANYYHDGVVIIAFFIEKGNQTNDNYGKLLKFISEVRYKDEKANFDGFSLRDITNDDLRYKEDEGKHLHYFMYEGTLDTPPCYYVKWMVFKDPIPISSFQLSQFRQLKRVKDRGIDAAKYDDYDKMAPNYRPLQELGDRTVYESHNYGGSADNTTSCFSMTGIASLVCMFIS